MFQKVAKIKADFSHSFLSWALRLPQQKAEGDETQHILHPYLFRKCVGHPGEPQLSSEVLGQHTHTLWSFPLKRYLTANFRNDLSSAQFTQRSQATLSDSG